MYNCEDKEYAVDSNTKSSFSSNIMLLVIGLTGDVAQVIAETEITPIGIMEEIRRDKIIEKAILKKVKTIVEVVAAKPREQEVTGKVVVLPAMAKKSTAEKAELIVKITAGELTKEITRIIVETEVTPIGTLDEIKRNEKIKEIMNEKVKIMLNIVTAKILEATSGEATRAAEAIVKAPEKAEAEALVEARTAADDHEIDEHQSHGHSTLVLLYESKIDEC